MDTSTIFISYSHHDKAWVCEWLLPRLEAAGLKVLIDTRDFAVGAPVLVNIERAVEASRRTLLVLTPALGRQRVDELRSVTAANRRPDRTEGAAPAADVGDVRAAEPAGHFHVCRFPCSCRAARRRSNACCARSPEDASPPWSANRPSLPNLVPSTLPPQPYFFGREAELQSIADAISPEARTWGALIDGPGGIGKTALAVRAGHLAPAQDFAVKIFLSAKVRELTPAGEQPLADFMLPNYMALLAELARELGEADIARSDPAERANTVRRALAGKRALIVIDNLETLAEAERVRVFQFLGRLPEGNKAIVTSRRRSDVDARAIRLDRLAAGRRALAAGRAGEAQPAAGARDRGRAADALRADARQPAADPVDGRAVGPGAVPHRGRGLRLPASRAAGQRPAGIHLRRLGGELQRERDGGVGRAGALHPARQS